MMINQIFCKLCCKNFEDKHLYKNHLLICQAKNTTLEKSFVCKFCGKIYKMHTCYKKHIILCEITKSKDNGEEVEKIPTIKQLYGIIQEMAVKYKKMEEKVEEMQKVLNKNNKINIVKYLNDSKLNKDSKLDITFKEWTKTIIVNDENINNLLENTFIDTIINIFKNNLKTNTQLPIVSFVQTNHKKLLRGLCIWSNNNQDLIKTSDKMCESYNKAIIKLMEVVEFKPGTLLNRVYINMYNILKKELNNVAIIDL
jgi:uncharacterized protein YihD (DUF1040 family)